MGMFLSSGTVELDLMVYHETELAYLMGEPGADRYDAVWIPKSQLEDDYEVGEVSEVEMPRWLAIDKELI